MKRRAIPPFDIFDNHDPIPAVPAAAEILEGLRREEDEVCPKCDDDPALRPPGRRECPVCGRRARPAGALGWRGHGRSKRRP